MAFLQDSRPPREPFLIAPATVLWLIGAIFSAHIVRVLLPEAWSDAVIERFAFIPARVLGVGDFAGATLADRILPFIGHIFLHANLAHVGLNCLWLLAVGPLVARRFRTPRFLAFFLFCGAAGAAIHLLVYGASEDAVVGASGAVSGLMGAAMRMVYGRVYQRRLAPVFSKEMMIFSAMWTLGNVLSGVAGLGVDAEFVPVAWVVHLGGYFTGMLTAGLFDRPWRAARWNSG